MLKIAIILGSTRPNRIGEGVARWAYEIAARRTDAHYDLIDLKDQNLPLLDEPAPPSLGNYSQPHTKAWAAKIMQYDGFVFVTAEYNHGIPGALKNAIDYLYKEWNNKAAGIVSYGSAYGARAAEALRLVMGELMIADVRQQVLLSLFTDFENYSKFKPDSAEAWDRRSRSCSTANSTWHWRAAWDRLSAVAALAPVPLRAALVAQNHCRRTLQVPPHKPASARMLPLPQRTPRGLLQLSRVCWCLSSMEKGLCRHRIA